MKITKILIFLNLKNLNLTNELSQLMLLCRDWITRIQWFKFTEKISHACPPSALKNIGSKNDNNFLVSLVIDLVIPPSGIPSYSSMMIFLRRWSFLIFCPPWDCIFGRSIFLSNLFVRHVLFKIFENLSLFSYSFKCQLQLD